MFYLALLACSCFHRQNAGAMLLQEFSGAVSLLMLIVLTTWKRLELSSSVSLLSHHDGVFSGSVVECVGVLP